MYDCYIFDLDGTLLDTLHDLVSSTNFALRQKGYPEHTEDEIRMMVGNGVEKLIRRAVPQNISEDDTLDTLRIFREYYLVHSEDTTAPYPGIMPLLKELKSRGKKIAVVSNKFDAATKKLCNKYFPNLIDIAIGEDEANGIRKKPNPDTVLKVLEMLYGPHPINTPNSPKAVYIGDSDVDIATASNAGIPSISVLWGFRSKDFLLAHGAERLISSPDELK